MANESLYSSTYQYDGFLSYYNPIDIPFDETDYYITVSPEYENKPGKLAYDMYGDARLLWVFRYFNNNKIEDMIFDLKPGMNLLVPTKSRLLNYV